MPEELIELDTDESEEEEVCIISYKKKNPQRQQVGKSTEIVMGEMMMWQLIDDMYPYTIKSHSILLKRCVTCCRLVCVGEYGPPRSLRSRLSLCILVLRQVM